MYPEIGYENGDVSSSSCNDPTSYLFDFIIGIINIKYKFSQDDLPFYSSLVIETYYNKEEKPNNTYKKYYDEEYIEELESDIDGYTLLAEISEILEKNKSIKI